MQFPAFPKPLARLSAALPPYLPSLAFAAAANLIAWPALREQDWEGVAGAILCLRISDLGLSLSFSVRADGFHAEPPGEAAVTFTAKAEDLAGLALRLEDPDTLFFDRRLRIEGDTDLGLRAKNLLDAVEIEAAAATLPLGLGPIALRLRRWALA
jgi:O2-independent ubiquinone biosynthesis accessory factor UbiT